MEQVDEREDDDPDHVDEVPVESGDLDRHRVLGAELALHRPNQSVSSQITPTVTCAPWYPVSTKNVAAEQVRLQREPFTDELT